MENWDWNFERFVAKRFLPRGRSDPKPGVARKSMSAPLVDIAVSSIALGVLVMVVSVCVLRGFQGEIRRKAVGFGAHVVVRSYATGKTYGETPIATDRPEVQRIASTRGVKHVQFFAEKGGMVKTEEQIHGIVLKGVCPDAGFLKEGCYDSSFFAGCLVEGRLVRFADCVPSNEVMVSQTVAKKLKLQVGDKVRTYFWQGTEPGQAGDAEHSRSLPYRARAFTVCGIYNTDLADFDEHYVVGDLRQVQRLNGWDSNQVAGYEVTVEDFARLDGVVAALLPQLGYDLTATTIVEQCPALFSWLDLLDSNIVLIIAIMLVVGAVSVVSALLIIIFEKTSTIGVLKALGATNGSVRRIFLLKAAGIVAKGIALGDAAALLLCWVQHRFALVRLDSESYSMSTVPVDLNGWIFVAVSVGTLAVCVAAMLLPASYIAHVEPAKTIKFD